MGPTIALPLTTAHSTLLVSLPLLGLFSEADACSLLKSIECLWNLKFSMEKLGVSARILLVHSLLWHHVKKQGLIYHSTDSFLLVEQYVPVPETFFWEELLISAQLFLHSLKSTCGTYSLALRQDDQRLLWQLHLSLPDHSHKQKPSSCLVPLLPLIATPGNSVSIRTLTGCSRSHLDSELASL